MLNEMVISKIWSDVGRLNRDVGGGPVVLQTFVSLKQGTRAFDFRLKNPLPIFSGLWFNTVNPPPLKKELETTIVKFSDILNLVARFSLIELEASGMFPPFLENQANFPRIVVFDW